MELRIVKVNDSTYKLLRKWRNENKDVFVLKKDVDLKTHNQWYKDYCETPNRIIYIIYMGKKPIGTVTLTLKNIIGTFDVVMLGDKKYERQGIMSKVMRKLMRTFDLPYYQLEVLAENKPAIKFYKKLGFYEADENKKRKTIIMQTGAPKI